MNDSFPTARKMRKIRLFASLTGGDGGCARDAGKGRGRNASDAVVFMILKGGSGFFAGASGGAPMKKAPRRGFVRADAPVAEDGRKVRYLACLE